MTVAQEAEAAFARRVHAARRAHGWTQRQLAERVGLDPSAITRIEQGGRGIRLGEAAAIAKEIGADLSELVDVADAIERAESSLAVDHDWCCGWRDVAESLVEGLKSARAEINRREAEHVEAEERERAEFPDSRSGGRRRNVRTVWRDFGC